MRRRRRIDRRSYLAATGAVVAGWTIVPAAGAEETDEEPPDEDLPVEEPTEYTTGYVRGEADADVHVERVEDDEHVSYLEESDEVEYVGAWRRTEDGDEIEQEPVYETTPWERWRETRSLSTAASAAADHVADELAVDDVGGGLTSRVDGRDRAAMVTVYDADAFEADDPAPEDGTDTGDGSDAEEQLSLDRVADATPATVDVTYVLDGHTHEAEVPIYARITGPPTEETASTLEDDDGTGPDGEGNESGDDPAAPEDRGVTEAVPGFGLLAGLSALAVAAVARRFSSDDDR